VLRSRVKVGGMSQGAAAAEQHPYTADERGSLLSGMRLTELVGEVQDRLEAVARSQARLQRLLDAFLSVVAGLDLRDTLRRIVAAATELVDARYGALGVLGPRGGLSTSSSSASPRSCTPGWAPCRRARVCSGS
jgi:hypothetical protein